MSLKTASAADKLSPEFAQILSTESQTNKSQADQNTYIKKWTELVEQSRSQVNFGLTFIREITRKDQQEVIGKLGELKARRYTIEQTYNLNHEIAQQTLVEINKEISILENRQKSLEVLQTELAKSFASNIWSQIQITLMGSGSETNKAPAVSSTNSASVDSLKSHFDATELQIFDP